MQLFRHRPLLLFLSVLLAGFTLYGATNGKWRAGLCLSAGCLAFLILIYCFIRNSKRRLAGAAVAVLLLSFLFSHLYFDLAFRADKRFSGTVRVCAVVTKIDYAEEYGGSFYVRTDCINETTFSHYRLYVCAEDCDVRDLLVGDRITFSALLTPTQADPDRSYLAGRGISAAVILQDPPEITEQNVVLPEIFFSSIRESLARYTDTVTEEEGAALLSALLLGEKSQLPAAVTLDFTRIGIRHLLALSGLHLSVLALGLTAILRLLRLGKRARLVTLCIFTLFYMALTGFSPSIVRAGIMVILPALLFLSGYPHDGLTTLSVAIFLIVLVTPYAVLDLSLWLSALATFGILLMPSAPRRKNPLLRFLSRPLSALAVSFFALGFTVTITAFSFDTLSLLSPLSTLIFGFLAEIYLYLGILTLVLGKWLPIGKLLSSAAHGIFRLAGIFSDLPGITAGTHFTAVRILVTLLALGLTFFLIFPVRHKRIAVTALSLLFLSVFAVAGIQTHALTRTGEITYRAIGTDEYLLIRSGGKNTLVDMSRTTVSDAGTLADQFAAENVTEIDCYILTEYTACSYAGIRQLGRRFLIRELILPEPENEEEGALYARLCETLAAARTVVRTTETGEITQAGDIRVSALCRRVYGEEGGLILLLLTENRKYAYFSREAVNNETASVARDIVSDADAVIFGARGRQHHAPFFLPDLSERPGVILLCGDSVSLSRAETETLARRGALVMAPARYVLTP